VTTTLIVLAHPEPRSFNGAWARATEASCRDLGHTVLWSDLCAMRFDPVERSDHYRAFPDTARFDPLKAQEAAAKADRLPPEVTTEIDKIRAADRVVFHFPLWWFAPPAILKGWFERVLAHGALHTVDERFDTGRCRGKTALFCVTQGADEHESAWNGKEGDIRLLLWPAAYTLRYLGFDVLDPVTALGVHGYHTGAKRSALHARLRTVLDAQTDLMRTFDTHPRLHFNADTDFDAQGRLKPEAASHSAFIRHEP
jgi:NAD(P)H dehydrogenase (quinone)